MRFMVFLEVRPPLLLLLRTAYSAATGSIQPLEMSAPAGSCKRSRADFEREGAPAEADAATAPTDVRPLPTPGEQPPPVPASRTRRRSAATATLRSCRAPS